MINQMSPEDSEALINLLINKLVTDVNNDNHTSIGKISTVLLDFSDDLLCRLMPQTIDIGFICEHNLDDDEVFGALTSRMTNHLNKIEGNESRRAKASAIDIDLSEKFDAFNNAVDHPDQFSLEETRARALELRAAVAKIKMYEMLSQF
jgi:hypothetical protein